jgi:hypothetical protein
MNLREIGWSGMDWIDLVQVRNQWMALVNTAMNLRVPWNVEKFLSGCTTGSFSRRAHLHGVSWNTGHDNHTYFPLKCQQGGCW